MSFNDRLIFEPTVHVMASTMLDMGSLDEWVNDLNLREIADKDGTPLNLIINDSFYTGMDTLTEFAGRQCYRSFAKGRPPAEYIANLIEQGHNSVFGHATVTFAIAGVSRSLTHELIRHHVGTRPSQESQRFVDAKDIRFVVPPLMIAIDKKGEPEGQFGDYWIAFRNDCERSLRAYQAWQNCFDEEDDDQHCKGVVLAMGDMKRKRIMEAARAVLPNCAETRLVWTTNMEAARHFFKQRGDVHADLEIRRLAVAMFRKLQPLAPLTFADMSVYEADDGFPAIRVALHGREKAAVKLLADILVAPLDDMGRVRLCERIVNFLRQNYPAAEIPEDA